MSDRIILSASDLVTCPHCSREFPLEDGLARKTIEHYQHEFDEELKRRSDKALERIAREERQKIEEEAQSKLDGLQRELNEAKLKAKQQQQQAEQKQKLETAQLRADLEASVAAARDFEKKIKDEKKAAERRVEKKFAEELAALKESLNEQDAKVEQFQLREIELLKEKRKLENARKELDLELQRKLDAATKEVEKKVSESEAERFRLKEAEYKKKIEDAQKSNDDLRRKLEQGSSQLHGEVLELELEQMLATAFTSDEIEAVKKGVRGADIVQTVRSRSGQDAGKILWESKRAENWSNTWIQKLKDDQRTIGATIAVIVTTSFPRGETQPFLQQDGIWIVSLAAVMSVADVLRLVLLEGVRQRGISAARDEAKSAVFDYLCSPAFAQKVRTTVEASMAMKGDIDAERNAMSRIWKKREQQADRILSSMMGMVGELQGMASDSLPGLVAVGQLESSFDGDQP